MANSRYLSEFDKVTQITNNIKSTARSSIEHELQTETAAPIMLGLAAEIKEQLEKIILLRSSDTKPNFVKNTAANLSSREEWFKQTNETINNIINGGLGVQQALGVSPAPDNTKTVANDENTGITLNL